MNNQPRWWPLNSGSTPRLPSLQTCLIALILFVLIPTLCAVALAIWRAGQSYRQDSTNHLLETASIVARSVESELHVRSHLLAGYVGSRPATRAGATPPWPFEGHLRFTHVEGGPAGLRVGTDSVPAALREVAIQAASSGQMAVSNVFGFDIGDGIQLPSLAIAVPFAAGQVDFQAATMIAQPADVVQSLEHRSATAGALVLAVTDGTGHIIARSRDAKAFIGKPVPDWQTLRALNRTSGTFEARTIEGPKVIFAFQTIQGTPGWVAVVGEPLTAFNSRWRQPLVVLLAVSATTILVAFLLAMLLARRMLRPIKRLAEHARAVAQGEAESETIAAEVPSSFVAEFETLRQSLESAEDETRRSHKALHDSFEALRRAEKLARIGSWSLDLATGQFTTSHMLYELNGADPNGPPLRVEDLQKLLTPEDAERTNAAIARCVETGEPYGLEVTHLRPDGSSFAAYIRGQATRIDAGRVVELSGTVQDISERKEEQERIATLADNLPSGAIYRVEQQPDGGLATTYCSAGIVRLIGVPAAEIVQDRSAFLNAIHPGDRSGYEAAMARSGEEGTPLDHAFRVHTRDGRLIWMHCRSAPRRQSDGRIIWDGIARDITGERQVAEALREAKEAAEAAERTKSDFLATMSHEIRTPMNTVIGMTRLMLKTDLAPKQRNYLEKIDVSAKTLLGIINDILDFSKIEAGGLELEDTAFTIESILESVSAVMAMPAEEKGLELAYAVAADVPRRVRGDPLRLGQVLTNLVSNAVKFTERGEVVITVTPVHNADGSLLLQFAVRDTGIGLSADQMAGLFQPFSQAGHDTSRKYGGTGLGLAICKRLAEMMGGRIWVESIPQQGSTFFFTIATVPAENMTVPDTYAQHIAHLTSRRVLIVDDNASARQILHDMMRAFGLSVETVSSGPEALSRIQAQAEQDEPFDLVLLDWRMPAMDGLEAARRIRANEQLPHMPAVLMVTAYGWEEVMRGAEQLGLEGVLIKPITESVMFNTIVDILLPQDLTKTARKSVSGSAGRYSALPEQTVYAGLAGKRILVVDDNALNREVATDFLIAVGVVVDTANDGVEALEKLDARYFDAVLMDMHMPRMDGLTAVREIRRQERWQHVPVIALTAQARVEDLAASVAAGMSAHLTKPIDEMALYRTLLDVLQRGSAQAGVLHTANAPDHQLDARFSLDATLRRFGGKTASVEKLLTGFLRDFSDVPQQLERYLRTQDFEAIAVLAHTMRGSAGYFDARDFCLSADQLERAARSSDVDGVDAQARVFHGELERLLDDVGRGVVELREREAVGRDG